MAYTTINKSSDYFNTKLYTGNGGTQSITGVGFQPDWLWIKSRNVNTNHNVVDAVRGSTKIIHPNTSSAEGTDASSITSFNSDGFSLGSRGDTNANSGTFVSWNWKANGQGSANTDGTINTTYTSANTTAGFSIPSYTGTGSAASVGHGLGVAPSMIMIKNRDGGTGWITYHKSLTTNGNYLLLNSSNAVATNTAYYSSAPSTTVINIGTSGYVNESSEKFIAYCFAEKTGYSKFGSYKGNGNADGPFIYTGFKPAFIILKNSVAGNNWIMKDSKRPGYNLTDDQLYPDADYTEDTNGGVDIVSNGFKARTTAATTNGNGSTYIYMAFAEAPLVGSNGVTAKAR